jgi:hypothetical protein
LLSVVGGNLLAEEQEIDFSRTANAQTVDTVAKGFAGMSPGTPMMEVDIHAAMPQGGFEFDAGPYIVSLTPIAVQVIGPGGKTAKGDCFIISDNGRHGVNQQARYSFRCVMALQQFK